MKIALVGATGFVGAATRRHAVTAIARNTAKIEQAAGVTVKQADVADADKLAKTLAGHDVVVSAFNGGWGDPDIYNKHLNGSLAIAKAAKAANVRLIVIGGAGSLYAPDGTQFVDAVEFPADYKQGALAARDVLAKLRDERELDWSFISPPFALKPGERSGKYRLGSENPVFNAAGESTISVADLAVAIIDEAESPKHSRKRFTVGY